MEANENKNARQQTPTKQYNPTTGTSYLANNEDLNKALDNINFQTGTTLEESEYTPMPKGYAFKAINPDTGELVKYFELRKCSDGAQCDRGMSMEVG